MALTEDPVEVPRGNPLSRALLEAEWRVRALLVRRRLVSRVVAAAVRARRPRDAPEDVHFPRTSTELHAFMPLEVLED